MQKYLTKEFQSGVVIMNFWKMHRRKKPLYGVAILYALLNYAIISMSRSFSINDQSGYSMHIVSMHMQIPYYHSAWEVQRASLGYTYQAGSYTTVVAFDLVVIPQWLVVIPRVYNIPRGKFKAPRSIIKRCVNTQINFCEQQLGTMDCFVVHVASKAAAEVQANYITLLLWDILHSTSASL